MNDTLPMLLSTGESGKNNVKKNENIPFRASPRIQIAHCKPKELFRKILT